MGTLSSSNALTDSERRFLFLKRRYDLDIRSGLNGMRISAHCGSRLKGTLGCVAIEVANSPLRSQELIATSRCTWTMAAAACCHPDEASICRHCTVPHEKTAPKDLGVVMFAAAQDASTGAPAKHQVRGCSSHSRRRG